MSARKKEKAILAIGACLIFIFAGFCWANESESRLLFGVDLGVNYSLFEYNDVPNYWDPEWACGFNIGVFALYPKTSKYLFQPSIRFIRLNNNVEIREVNTPDENSLGGRFEMVQDYIALATCLRIDRIIGERLFFVIGPEFALLVRATNTTKRVYSLPSDPDRSFINTNVLDYYDDMEKLNVMVDVGVGISFDIEGRLGYWQIMYVHGFTGNRESPPEEAPGVSFDWKSREIRISFGITI